MSHALKIFPRIIYGLIRRKCKRVCGGIQFNFRKGLGTREAIFEMEVMLQQCYNHHQDASICFIDYKKVFDTVRHEPLTRILEKIDLYGPNNTKYWRQ